MHAAASSGHVAFPAIKALRVRAFSQVVTDQRWQHDAQYGAYFQQTYGGGAGKTRDLHTDLDGRLWAIISKLHQGFQYEFDDRDRIIDLTNFAHGKWSQVYDYDDMNRLVYSDGLGGYQHFRYDASGNRTRHIRGIQTSISTISPTSNRLNSSDGHFTRTYTYRATGQVAEFLGPLSGGDPIFGGGFKKIPYVFSYDPFNRLSGITGRRFNASYKVAATGMRVEKTAATFSPIPSGSMAGSIPMPMPSTTQSASLIVSVR